MSTYSRPQSVRRVLRISTIAVFALVLSACTTPESPPLPFPDVVWDEGTPGGELEDDVWVQATRTSMTALDVARNQNDFRLPELEATSGYDVRAGAWRDARDTVDAGERTPIAPGPQPLDPRAVTVSAEGSSATVQACVALDWRSVDGAVPTTLTAAGAEYHLERTDDDHIILTRIVGLPGLECADASFTVGRFDPTPEPSEVTSSDDVLRPDTDPSPAP